MRAWIITACPVSGADAAFYQTIRPKNDDMVVCADGGYDNAVMFGMFPSVVVGDMDSIHSSIPKTIKTIKFPAEKDKTDTELAIDYAMDAGATEVVILGNLSGRIDHTLAVILLLRYIAEKGAEGLVLSARQRVCLLKNGETVIHRGESKYLSLIPLTECEDVTILRAKYELKGEKLSLGSTLGISNQFTALDVKISIGSGEALIVTENEPTA